MDTVRLSPTFAPFPNDLYHVWLAPPLSPAFVVFGFILARSNFDQSSDYANCWHGKQTYSHTHTHTHMQNNSHALERSTISILQACFGCKHGISGIVFTLFTPLFFLSSLYYALAKRENMFICFQRCCASKTNPLRHTYESREVNRQLLLYF